MVYEGKTAETKESNIKPRAVILSPTSSQPRYHRRASMLLAAGYTVEVYAFERNFYVENTFPSSVTVTSLGEIESGRYFTRIPKLLRAVFRVRRYEKRHSTAPALVYAFGLDMAMIGKLAMPTSIPLVYEVGDVQNPLPHDRAASKFFSLVERNVMARCQMLAVTSPGFISDYFGILNPEIVQKTMVIENKLAREIAEKFSRPSKPKVPTRPLKIGYIGAFKYENCIFPLIHAVAKRKGDFELHFYGDGSLKKDILEYVAKHDNVFYHGSFASTQDLQKIYDAVHLSYVVYDNHDPNVRMALPNKLYDGPYFGVPLVVAENTLLAKRVRELGIGLVADPRAENYADVLLDGLSPELLTNLSAAALKLELCHMVESYDEIVPVLSRLGRNKTAIVS